MTHKPTQYIKYNNNKINPKKSKVHEQKRSEHTCAHINIIIDSNRNGKRKKYYIGGEKEINLDWALSNNYISIYLV